ncbi:hypothetical protein ABVV53_15295 [Novosphingobium sp. RD2P27]|uniref:VanZ family protein n=1 Tax=Novosphingobium kalidii TaxID=3230299 RepID=A0ABV2D514_9SPHN
MSLASMIRVALWLAVALTLFLALSPGPAGEIISDGTTRHILAFLVLPWLLMAAYPRLSLWWVFAAHAVFGGVIELAQLIMAVGRHGSWLDWMLDLVTTATAIAIAIAVRHIVRREYEA